MAKIELPSKDKYFGYRTYTTNFMWHKTEEKCKGFFAIS